MSNSTADDVKKFFAGIGDGLKRGGDDLVGRQVATDGYVAFRKEAAMELFMKDHADWKCIFKDGEYRFYPPTKDSIANRIKSKFEETKKNDNRPTRISIKIDCDICHYQLVVLNKYLQLGEPEIIKQEETMSSKDMMEIFQELLIMTCDGLPFDDQDKGEYIRYDTVNGNELTISGMNEEQRAFIKHVQELVDMSFQQPTDGNAQGHAKK